MEVCSIYIVDHTTDRGNINFTIHFQWLRETDQGKKKKITKPPVCGSSVGLMSREPISYYFSLNNSITIASHFPSLGLPSLKNVGLHK